MLEAGVDTAHVAAHLTTTERSVRRLRNRLRHSNQQKGSLKDRPCRARPNCKVTTHHAEDGGMVALHERLTTVSKIRETITDTRTGQNRILCFLVS